MGPLNRNREALEHLEKGQKESTKGVIKGELRKVTND
jgi:hypothetical protein